ncbi:MAG: ABC transporter transmembrane domain-containing protein, partial [Solirubrobacteraceae bacterium]
MIDRRFIALAAGAWRPILRTIAIGLAITATYAGQGFAIASILTAVFAGEKLAAILPMVGVVAALQAVRAALVWRREIAGQIVAGAVKRVVRERLYRRLLELGPGYTTGTRTGQAQSTIVDAVETLEKYYSRFLPQFAVTLIGATVLAAYVVSVDAVVGAVVVVGALLVLVSLIGSRYIMRPAMKRWFDDYKALYAESLDAVQGMTTLKAFNAHERRARLLHDEGERFAKSSIGLMVAASVPYGLVGVAASSGIALSVGVGAMRLAAGHVTVSELFILLLLARECFRPLTDLQHAFHSAYGAPAAAQGVFALLTAPPVLRVPAAT